MVLRLYDEIKIKKVEVNRGCYYFFIMKKKVVIVMYGNYGLYYC